MPNSCCTSTCKFKSIAKCPCCNKYFCRSHFLQHDLLLRSKFHRSTEQIDELTKQYQILDMKKLTGEFVHQLDQWRVNSYRIIDEFYQKKYNEIHQYIETFSDKYEENLLELRFELAEIVNQQKTNEDDLKNLRSHIQNLKNQIKRASVQFNINPLIIPDDLINVRLSQPNTFDLNGLKSPYQKVARVPFSSDAMIGNDEYLLLHQNSNLYLINENVFVKRQRKWPHGWIRDMCWSQTLKSFFLVTFDEIYLVKQDSLKIKHLKSIKDKSWQCCTCSDTSLYLTKDLINSTVEEYSFKPSIKLINNYERLEMKDGQQRIDSMEYHNETLVLVVNDQLKKEIFIELRSIPTFDRLWTCQLLVEYTERKIQCNSLGCQGWMVMDPESSSLSHITEEGILADVIKYNEKIYYINFFGMNTMVISAQESINFHQL